MSTSKTRRRLLAGAALLLPALSARGFWMPGTGPCAWMADGLMGGMGNRGYGGVPYYYPPPPLYSSPPYQREWPPPYPANVHSGVTPGGTGAGPEKP